jgi:hypothetical protein
MSAYQGEADMMPTSWNVSGPTVAQDDPATIGREHRFLSFPGPSYSLWRASAVSVFNLGVSP